MRGMELTEQEKIIQQQARESIEARRDELIDTFILKKNPLRLGFITIFMAGSPGAGKTEFSQKYMPLIVNDKYEKLIKILRKEGVDVGSANSLFVRIDVDEIREFLTEYQKTDIKTGVRGNAHVVQKAANDGLDILRDYCLENEISFLHDGTFGNYDTMEMIVKKSIKAGRDVQIYYLYLDPLTAWEFTKAREYLEGRNIIKEKFVEQYFKSRENVDKIKKKFGDKVKIHCILKNCENVPIETAFNEQSVDKYLETKYNSGVIKRYSAEDLLALIS